MLLGCLCNPAYGAPSPTRLADLPVDLSFLNAAERPAGKHGFLSTRGSELIFQDGAIARFWGANLTANAVFGTPKEDVRRQAARLSQLGFNMIRLHHLDSAWVVPNIFGAAGSSTNRLNPDMLEKLDWWIKCLRDEGIYIWLDLHVGREVRAADGIDGFDEMAKGTSSAALNGYSYVNDSIREAMKRFDEQLLTHANAFTGLRYLNDPSIAVMLITNENDVTHHFGNALLPDKQVPKHTALYLRQANAFASQHHLSQDRVWRAWQDGPAKLFLNDLEERFNVDMIDYLHKLGAKPPIVTTSSWGMDPLSSLPALSAGDIIDAHSYGGSGELDANPLQRPNLLAWLAAAQIINKPMAVSEWGADRNGQTANDRQILPIYVASAASMQGWRAVLFYAYAQEPLLGLPGKASVYQAYNDPALLATMPAAALLFRARHVAEATATYAFVAGDQLFEKSLTPASSVALRTASERGKLVIALPGVTQLPWLKETAVPKDAIILRNSDKPQIVASAAEVTSDDGELTRNWQRGVLKVSTRQSQAVLGNLCCDTITLPQLQVELQGPHTVAAVQSLDRLPIKTSHLLMISIGAGAVPSRAGPDAYDTEPVIGSLRVTARPGMQLLEWSESAARLETRPAPYENGKYLIQFNGEPRSSWLFLVPARM